jgi:hypothetical protein
MPAYKEGNQVIWRVPYATEICHMLELFSPLLGESPLHANSKSASSGISDISLILNLDLPFKESM